MLTIEEVVLRAAKIKAARTGKRESQVIEEAVPPTSASICSSAWQRNQLSRSIVDRSGAARNPPG